MKKIFSARADVSIVSVDELKSYSRQGVLSIVKGVKNQHSGSAFKEES